MAAAAIMPMTSGNIIYPRAPCGARQRENPVHHPAIPRYFNPCAPYGARPFNASAFGYVTTNFNPRAPCGARQRRYGALSAPQRFQSTRPLRGATTTFCFSAFAKYFNPRAPCGARHGRGVVQANDASDFNPRAPCGARRFFGAVMPLYQAHFNPRAPCGARPERGEILSTET